MCSFKQQNYRHDKDTNIMKRLPLDFGSIHFIGIGGIGMSGLAEILNNLGYHVHGSDMKDGANVQRLAKLGIETAIGHDGVHLKDAQAVVVSSAIKPDNPELIVAKEKNLIILPRAQMLAEIMRMKWAIAISGTHGKTTTTSLVGHVLEKMDLDPTVINGGIINAYGSNTRLGQGDWLVAEADESDQSFRRLWPVIGVVLNIDPEHMENYGDFDAMKQAYREFLSHIPFYGLGVLCVDHPVVKAMLPELGTLRTLTYGFDDNAQIRGSNIVAKGAKTYFSAHFPCGTQIDDICLPMTGQHNVQNALSALAILFDLSKGDLDHAHIQHVFDGFDGVKRRFTTTGIVNDIQIIDDYGHHPVEIKAVLQAATSTIKTRDNFTDAKIHVVMQPHRYSRLHDLFDDFAACFDTADTVHILPVYAAGEPPIIGADGQSLVNQITKITHIDAHYVTDIVDLTTRLYDTANAGDMIIFLGAGDITTWANEMPKRLEDMFKIPKTN